MKGFNRSFLQTVINMQLILLRQHQTYHWLGIPVLNLPQKELEFLILRHVL